MDTDDDVDVIFSELCADVEIDGRFLELLSNLVSKRSSCGG